MARKPVVPARTEVATDSDDAAPAPEVGQPAVEVEAPEGVFDLEQWVADVYDYQNNGGPAPVRKYLPVPEAPTAP